MAAEDTTLGVGPQPERLVTCACGDCNLVSALIAFELSDASRDLHSFAWRSAVRRQFDLDRRTRAKRQGRDRRLPESIESFVRCPSKAPRVEGARKEHAAIADR